jgi:ketosteroid isomerase-like protein
LISKSAAEADVLEELLSLLLPAKSDKSKPPAKQASKAPFSFSISPAWTARERLEEPGGVVMVTIVFLCEYGTEQARLLVVLEVAQDGKWSMSHNLSS